MSNPFADFLASAGKQLLSRAANGAAEAVLDEVQGAVREVDKRITKARKRAANQTKVKSKSEPEIMDGEIVDPPGH